MTSIVRIVIGSIAAICVLTAPELRGQPATVSVAVTVVDSTRQIESLFASALRQLGDVRVVTVGENPDYVLSGVVVCNPSCDKLSTYSIALRLYSPVRESLAEFLAEATMRRLGIDDLARQDSVRATLWSFIGSLEETHQAWVATWGRNAYERAIREMVREIDSTCFEKQRMFSRLFQLAPSDSAIRRRLTADYRGRSWQC